MAEDHLPVAVSSTDTYLSEPINIKNLDNVLLQLIWTGDPAGVFTVQQSPDGVLYDDLPLSPDITQPAGAEGHWSVNVNQSPAEWLQVQYVNASGSGTVDVIVTAKDLN